VLQDRVDGDLVAVDDGEARRPAGRPRLEQLGIRTSTPTDRARRLQDEGVAAGDRHRVHPHRHHGREVERRDAGDDAERLAQRPAVDLGPDILGDSSPFSSCGMPQANSTTSLPRTTSPSRVGQHLAVLAGEDRGDVLLPAIDQLPEREQDLGALGERGALPARGGGLGRGHRLIDHRRRRQRDARLDLAGRGVEHVAEALGGPLVGLPVDPVPDDGVGHGPMGSTAAPAVEWSSPAVLRTLSARAPTWPRAPTARAN
jgi:hypothetical protein